MKRGWGFEEAKRISVQVVGKIGRHVPLRISSTPLDAYGVALASRGVWQRD